jgi:hypothetical protein
MQLEDDDLKDIFEENYKDKLDMSFDEWMQQAPETEEEAYARLDAINEQLKETHDEWFEATGDQKDELEEERDRLKVEYDLIEEMFHLEIEDK